jgi:hypothetical protein
LGRDVEPERFDGDESIVLRVVRAKNRSQYAAANLVQDAIRAKGEGRGVAGGLVERQRRNSLSDQSTLPYPFCAIRRAVTSVRRACSRLS